MCSATVWLGLSTLAGHIIRGESDSGMGQSDLKFGCGGEEYGGTEF